MIKNFYEFLKYKEFLKNLVAKDLKVRYKRSILGYFWTMLSPLLTMIVLTVVFSSLFRFDMKNYSIFLICGILPWNFFCQSVSIANMSIIGGAGIIKKVYVPKVIFPFSNVTSNLVNFALAIIPLFVLKPALGSKIALTVLFLPVPIALLYVFTAGVSLIFATLNVFFRDMAHITEVIFAAWLYATPVFYPIDMIPEKYLPIFKLNPMYYFVTCFRMTLYDGALPGLRLLGISLIIAIITFSFGWWFFHRCENNFIYYL